MNILNFAGIYCERLAEFGKSLNITTDKILDNVWLGHKNELKKIEIQQNGLSCRTDWHGQLPPCRTQFRSFDAIDLLTAVVMAFRKKTLVDYIFKECYLLMRWKNDSFEDIIISDLNDFLARTPRPSTKKEQIPNPDTIISNFDGDRLPRWPRKRKLAMIKKKHPKNWDIENVSLDLILYNCKQHQQQIVMPENLLRYILNASRNDEEFKNLKIILDDLVEREKNFSQSNGYYKMFQKHINHSCSDDLLRPVSKNLVISFTCEILRRLLPMALFGNSNRIRKRFYSVTAQFISCDKQQIFSLQWFVECFSPLPQWMVDIRFPASIKVLKYLVTELISNLLKNFFYITECGVSGNELFYYKKSDFAKMAHRKISELVKTGGLVKVNESDNFERKWLENRLEPGAKIPELDHFMPAEIENQPAAAKVRFLPKRSNSCETRMITIAQKPRLVGKQWEPYTKRQFERSGLIKSVKIFLDGKLSTYGTGIHPLYTNLQLKKAWDKIKKIKASGGNVYFVKTDIMDAFGSVDHERLFKVIERWGSKADIVPEMAICEWVLRRRKLIKVCRTSFSTKPFENRILHSIQHSARKQISSKFLMIVLKQIVCMQCLRIDGVLYRVQVGLCQGGAGGLSPRLCDLYYSGLDRGLEAFTNCDKSLLLRGMDDYLFVTLDKAKAMAFHNMVTNGVPLYKTQFNSSKLVTNLFDNSHHIFPYLGLFFDINALTVEPNFSRYVTCNVLHFVKLSYGNKDPRLHRDQFMIDRCLNFNSLKLVSIVYGNDESDCSILKRALIASCHLQVKRILAFALYLNVSVATLRFALAKISTKLAYIFQKLCTKISKFFLLYVFYQISFSLFSKYDSRFYNITKIIQTKLIRLYDRLGDNHDEIEKLLSAVDVKLWQPWKYAK